MPGEKKIEEVRRRAKTLLLKAKALRGKILALNLYSESLDSHTTALDQLRARYNTIKEFPYWLSFTAIPGIERIEYSDMQVSD